MFSAKWKFLKEIVLLPLFLMTVIIEASKRSESRILQVIVLSMEKL